MPNSTTIVHNPIVGGMLAFACPDWCRDTSTEHRDNQATVELINELDGFVHVEATHAGPEFGHFARVQVVGTQNLIDGSWRYLVRNTRNSWLGPGEGLEELIENLEAAQAWIAAQA